MMEPLTATPAQKMVLSLNITHRGSIYEGTASAKATAKRRAKNKVARQSRKANR